MMFDNEIVIIDVVGQNLCCKLILYIIISMTANLLTNEANDGLDYFTDYEIGNPIYN